MCEQLLCCGGCTRSEYGQAFEPKDGSSADRESSSEKNSFFVTAIKDVLNTQANSDSESISDFLRNVQKSEFSILLSLTLSSSISTLPT